MHKEEKSREQGPVLVMYDVCEIQEYIFRTNKVKEIIGASNLVKNIIMEALKESIYKSGQGNYILIWEQEDGSAKKEIEILNPDTGIEGQVLYIGGGNAYMLFRSKTACHKINRCMSKYLLEKTYSLHLAIAMVDVMPNKESNEKGNSFAADYMKVQEKMNEVKRKIPYAMPLGVLPVLRSDEATGFPVVGYVKESGGTSIAASQEILHKRKHFEEEKKEVEKIFDNMVQEKGVDSMLAIVHIDGNNMGERIEKLIQSADTYEEGIHKMRVISSCIKNGFQNTYLEMEKDLKNWTSREDFKFNGKTNKKQYIRKIISAGDDLTFVCNGKLALYLAEYFLKKISREVMYQEEGVPADKERYGLTACAGIAYFDSHFPFHDAYMVAEACCGSAKKKAKQKEAKLLAGGQPEGGCQELIGNWVDFQICRHMNIGNLKGNRIKNYLLEDGSYLLSRPYYIPFHDLAGGCAALDRMNEKHSIENFKRYYQCFTHEDFSNSYAKKLRNAFPQGMDEVKKLIKFMESRMMKLPEQNGNVLAWYDPLEMMDLYVSPPTQTEQEAEEEWER